MPPELPQEPHCDRCKQRIPFFTEHVRLTVTLTNDRTMRQTYCPQCCADPSMAVLFADVMAQPVKIISVRKVWS